MDCLLVGPIRRPGTVGREVEALTHFTLSPFGPHPSAVESA